MFTSGLVVSFVLFVPELSSSDFILYSSIYSYIYERIFFSIRAQYYKVLVVVYK